MIHITLPDGSVRTFEQDVVTPLEVAKNISNGLAKKAIVAKVNDEMVGLNQPITADSTVSIYTFDDAEGRETFRHSTSHILAQAVQKLFPGTKLGIGPAIKDGFYYDFDSEHKFTPADLEAIEAEMMKIVQADETYTRQELSREDAIKLFTEKNEPYKVRITYHNENGVAELLSNLGNEYSTNAQEISYNKIKERLEYQNLEIEDEEVYEDNTIVLTINLE